MNHYLVYTYDEDSRIKIISFTDESHIISMELGLLDLSIRDFEVVSDSYCPHKTYAYTQVLSNGSKVNVELAVIDKQKEDMVLLREDSNTCLDIIVISKEDQVKSQILKDITQSSNKQNALRVIFHHKKLYKNYELIINENDFNIYYKFIHFFKRRGSCK